MDYPWDPNPLVDSYNSAFFGELAREIQKNGYDLMLHYIKDYSEVNYCLKSWKVAGAVFIGFFDDNIRQIQEDNHIPLVFTDSYSTVRRITNVGIDDFHGGELAAGYLLSKGHTELAFIGPEAIGKRRYHAPSPGFLQLSERSRRPSFPGTYHQSYPDRI